MRLSGILIRWFAPIAAIAFVWGALFIYLARDRANHLATARTTTANLSQALEESLVRTIREIDQTLLYVRALRTRDQGAIDLRPWIESVDPENRLAAQITTADRDGIVTLSNLRPTTTRVDLSDRPHFRHFADHPDDHLFISVPVLGRVSKLWTIQFVRMLKAPEGGFDGIIVLSVPPEHLVRFYDAVDIGKYGRISVVGLDGTLRATAGGGRKAGEHLDTPFLAQAAVSKSGQFRWQDPGDGITRIGSFRKLAAYPLVVSVEMAESEITAKDDRAAPSYVFVGVVLTLVIALFSVTAGRQRQHAEAARRLTDLALQHVGVGIMVVSPAGRIGILNDRARRILGLPPSFGAGVPYAELIAWQTGRGELTPAHLGAEALHALLGPRPWRDVPARFRRTLPDNRIVETRTETLPDGTIVHSLSDITAEEEAQRTLTEARDAAEAAVRARAQFLAAMSHEIRTPLNGILGVNELLRSTSMTGEQREYATIIQQAGEHLLEMLTEILDYSKIDQQGVELERIAFDPGGVARQVVALLRPRATAQDLELHLALSDTLPAQVMGDPHRIRQVLFNLIGNAIKFTPTGRVDVTVGAGVRDAGHWRLDFAVADTGIGIDAAGISRLFQEFTQSDGSITRRFGGTGLGLAICRRLVEAMGGAITVDSAKGRGSTFGFHVCVAAVSAVATVPPVAEATGADWDARIARRAPVVLLAEDSQVNRLVASRMLERLGCRVRVAENGLQALEAVRDGGIDLVLMDVMMPEMDGLAATRAIRALPGPAANLPIIGLSANAFRSDQDAGRAAGMNGFATKPIDRERLGAEIVAALGLPAAPGPLPEVHATEVCAPEGRAPEVRASEVCASEVYAQEGRVADAPAPGVPVPGVPAPEAGPLVAEPELRCVTVLRELCDALGATTVMAVVEAFRNDTPVILSRLREVAVAGDSSGVAREAHALSGTAGTLGLTLIQEAARQMERAARSDGAVPDQAALAAFEIMVQGQIAALAGALDPRMIAA